MVTGPYICSVQLAVQCKDKTHSVLGYRVRRIGWDPQHFYSAGGGFQVHVVVAGAAHCYHPDAIGGQLFYNLSVNGVVYEGAYGVAAGGHAYGVFIQLVLKKADTYIFI